MLLPLFLRLEATIRAWLGSDAYASIAGAVDVAICKFLSAIFD
jgi:hypothetical protein